MSLNLGDDALSLYVQRDVFGKYWYAESMLPCASFEVQRVPVGWSDMSHVGL